MARGAESTENSTGNMNPEKTKMKKEEK